MLNKDYSYMTRKCNVCNHHFVTSISEPAKLCNFCLTSLYKKALQDITETALAATELEAFYEATVDILNGAGFYIMTEKEVMVPDDKPCPAGCRCDDHMVCPDMTTPEQPVEFKDCPDCLGSFFHVDPASGRCEECQGRADNPVSYDSAGYYDKGRGAAKPSGHQVSRDDQNRRLRESRLGYAEPSEDWENAGIPIIGLWDGQNETKNGIMSAREHGFTKLYQYWTKTTCYI